MIRNAIITLGEQGAVFYLPTFNDGAVVETTGAGGAFSGGLALGLAQNLDPLSAVRLGCATAGISVTRPGIAPSMPTMDEVQKLL